jgi:hypothetical protein
MDLNRMSADARPLSAPATLFARTNGAPDLLCYRALVATFATTRRVFHQANYKIRPLSAEDEPILWTMLYHGLHAAGAENAPSPEVVRQPEFAHYVEGWGRPHDTGFLAHNPDSEEVLGAVWFRSPIPAKPNHSRQRRTRPSSRSPSRRVIAGKASAPRFLRNGCARIPSNPW